VSDGSLHGPDAPWARFDVAWYAARYPDAVAEAGSAAPEALAAHYAHAARAGGHAPNPFFDERFYLARYPEIAAAVRAGAVPSGFAHYCGPGHREGRDPHWLFSERLYRALNPELDQRTLAAGGFASGYDHYLRVGDAQGRRAGPFLDPAHALARMAPAAAAAARETGVFRHLVTLSPGAADAIDASPWFDGAWYRGAYPAVAKEIAAGRWQGALHHYLANDTPTAFDPAPMFAEAYYLHRYPDVAAAVAAGTFRNGYAHFLAHGAAEFRSPAAEIDLEEYAAAHVPAGSVAPAARGLAAFGRLLAAFRAPAAARRAAVAARRPDVLVLGMHRSGTSFVAGQLVRAGLGVPGTAMLGDGGTEGGFFEPREVVALNEAMLRAAGGGWHDFLRPRLAEGRLGASATALLGNLLAAPDATVIKDPRMCLALPAWLDALDSIGRAARLVVVVRSPHEVALSLQRRNGFSLAHGRLLWARYNLELLRGLAARGRRPDALLRYDALDAGMAALAPLLGLPGLAGGIEGWRPSSPVGGPDQAPDEAAEGLGGGLEALAAGISDVAAFMAAAPALERALAPAEALAPLIAPLLDPNRRMEP
jgi:hypothetical protein